MNFDGYDNVCVAVQRRARPQELLDLQDGDQEQASWVLDAVISAQQDGFDVSGPYIQGPIGQRFIYLSWGDVDGAGTFAMFRRAKLTIADIDPDVLAAAARSGRLLARLDMSDAAGRPICARVRPPHVQWSAPSG